MSDHGREPYIVDIERTTLDNDTFRTTLWTGDHLQLTVMSIAPGDDIGLEVHHETDQFLAPKGKELPHVRLVLERQRPCEEGQLALIQLRRQPGAGHLVRRG